MDISGRSLRLSKPLLNQLGHVARGEVDTEGDAFELSGDIRPARNAEGPLIIKGSISDYDVLGDFIGRANVANPFDYIRHFLGTQTLWLPLFRFVLLHARPIPKLIVELDRLPKLKPKSWVKLRSRLEGKLGRKETYTVPDEDMLLSLDAGESIHATTVKEAVNAMKTLSSVDMPPLAEVEAAVFETLESALAVFDANPTNALFTQIRYAASFVDQRLYREKCFELG